MFRGDRNLCHDRAKSSRKRRLSKAQEINMTAPQASLRQSNQGEIAMNGAFSQAWGRRL
jgi:hypothetical protein